MRRYFWGLAAVAFACGCGQILGDDFEILSDAEWEQLNASAGNGSIGAAGTGGETATGGAAAAGGTAGVGPNAPVTCTPGELSCAGSALQECNIAGSGFNTLQVCESEELCDAALGVCTAPLCEPTDFRCSGAELQRCAGSRDSWVTVDTCASAVHCNASYQLCSAEACLAGEISCSGAELWRCNDARTDWELIDTCDTPSLCNEAAGECGSSACEVNELQCNGDTLERCNATRTEFELEETCGEEQLVLVYEDNDNGIWSNVLNAVDGDEATSAERDFGGGPGGGGAPFIEFSLGGFRRITKARVNGDDSGFHLLEAYRVARADGNNSWDNITDWVDTPTAGWHEVEIDPVLADQVRFYFDAPNGLVEVFEIELYADGSHCNTASPSCGPCETGTFACDELGLFVCDPSGRTFIHATDCQLNDCDADEGSCDGEPVILNDAGAPIQD